MPPTIPNWKVWPAAAPAETTRFTLHLFVHELTGLPEDGIRWEPTGELAVRVEWRGNRRAAEAVLRPPRRSSTSRRPACPDGSASWEEGLSHPCHLKMQPDHRIYKSWIIHLEILGFGFRSSDASSLVLGKARIDAAAYASMKGKSLSIPVPLDVKGFVSIGSLTLTMEFMEEQRKERRPWPLLRVLSLSFRHKAQASTSKEEDTHETRPMSMPISKPKPLSSISFSVGDREVGRTNSLRVLMVDGEEEVGEEGRWERRRVVSRDGMMEMVTEVFFASIDQCSEKAAGEGACAVLVAVIADWLHRNKGTLPLREELDEMIRTGSSEWRALCSESTHRRRFSDRHFDLETILTAKVRPLALVTALSYVGFFAFDDGITPDGLEYLDHAMSFDTILDHLVHAIDGYDHDEERVYIASWNDHFFVLKVARDAIYLIDTLGERLQEGCNQAHVIKFSDESVVRTVPEDGEPEEAVCRGVGACCREYMKGFLAAVPLRELRSEIERGAVSHADVHRRLQIEFHYTVPLH